MNTISVAAKRAAVRAFASCLVMTSLSCTWVRDGELRLEGGVSREHDADVRDAGGIASADVATSGGLDAAPSDAGARATTKISINVQLDRQEDVLSLLFDVSDPATYNHTLQVTIIDLAGQTLYGNIYFVRRGGEWGCGECTWEWYTFVGSLAKPGEDVAAGIGILEFDTEGRLVREEGALDFDVPAVGRRQHIVLSWEGSTSVAHAYDARRIVSSDEPL